MDLRQRRYFIPEIAGVLAVICAWQAVSLVTNPLTVPGPVRSIHALIDNNFFWLDLLCSLARALIASIIVTVLGLLTMRVFFYVPAIASASNWTLGFWRSVPPVVLIPPVFLLVAEREYSARILLAVVGSYPIFMANIVSGLKAIPPSRLETVRLLSRGDNSAVFEHVVKKEIIPYVMVGFRITFAFCLIIVVVSEMLWGTSGPGIGTRVRDASGISESPQAWGIICLLGVAGVGVNLLLDWTESKLVFWTEREGS